MTKDLKVKLFNFKNSLTLDQRDVAQIVEAHVGFCDQYSELEVYHSLNEMLKGQSYFSEVKGLLEGIAETFTTDQLLFELKDAYRKIERKNQGQIYRHPLDVLLGVINSSDSTARMEKIVNELSVYDWVPEIKTIMWKVSTSPTDRQNYSSNGGKATTVRTIATKVAEGHLAFIQNKWFLIKEDAISITLLEKHIEDIEQLRKMRLLEEAMKNCEIGNNRIDFRLSENLTLGLSLKNPGKIFLNESEAEKETTLETLFQSPLVSYVNRNFYPVIAEAMQNIDKFIDLDIVKKVSNPLRNHIESYAFNYGTGNYMYRVDKRQGSSLMKYESASGLIEDVMKELDYDLTPFYENKVTKEVKVKHKLEEAEKVITEQLAEVADGILTLEMVDAEIADDANIVAAKNELLEKQVALRTQLEDVRVAKSDQLNKDYANQIEAAPVVVESVEADAEETVVAEEVVAVTEETVVTEEVAPVVTEETVVTEEVAPVVTEETVVTEEAATTTEETVVVTESVDMLSNKQKNLIGMMASSRSEQDFDGLVDFTTLLAKTGVQVSMDHDNGDVPAFGDSPIDAAASEYFWAVASDNE